MWLAPRLYPPRTRRRPRIERLEDRSVPATFTVTTTLDEAVGGAGSGAGRGWTALGGGIHIGTGSTLTVRRSQVTNNAADGGPGGDSGAGGRGAGGGVSHLGTFLPDAASEVEHNPASTSNDTCSGRSRRPEAARTLSGGWVTVTPAPRVVFHRRATSESRLAGPPGHRPGDGPTEGRDQRWGG